MNLDTDECRWAETETDGGWNNLRVGKTWINFPKKKKKKKVRWTKVRNKGLCYLPRLEELALKQRLQIFVPRCFLLGSLLWNRERPCVYFSKATEAYQLSQGLWSSTWRLASDCLPNLVPLPALGQRSQTCQDTGTYQVHSYAFLLLRWAAKCAFAPLMSIVGVPQSGYLHRTYPGRQAANDISSDVGSAMNWS